MFLSFCVFAISIVGEMITVVDTDPSEVELQEVIFEENISDEPEEDENLDEDDAE